MLESLSVLMWYCFEKKGVKLDGYKRNNVRKKRKILCFQVLYVIYYMFERMKNVRGYYFSI